MLYVLTEIIHLQQENIFIIITDTDNDVRLGYASIQSHATFEPEWF